MQPPDLRHAALALVAAGVNDCEIARRLGIPRSTVRDWRRMRQRPRGAGCPRCWRKIREVAFVPGDYAELLGLYLGDGHITQLPRTQRLRISLDAKYPVIVAEADALLQRCFPRWRVQRVRADEGQTVVLCVYHSHLSCLFPRHGPGKKHERRLHFEPWQLAEIDAAPWAFIRGCIRSDGCTFVNRTGIYEYLSYEFSNKSPEIVELFLSICESLGLVARRYARYVRIYQRPSVELLLANVGTKA